MPCDGDANVYIITRGNSSSCPKDYYPPPVPKTVAILNGHIFTHIANSQMSAIQIASKGTYFPGLLVPRRRRKRIKGRHFKPSFGPQRSRSVCHLNASFHILSLSLFFPVKMPRTRRSALRTLTELTEERVTQLSSMLKRLQNLASFDVVTQRLVIIDL